MEIRVISSKEEIPTIENVEIVHMAFRPANKDIFTLIQTCPGLKSIQIPNSYMKTISKSALMFLEMHNVTLMEGDLRGHRKDINEYYEIKSQTIDRIEELKNEGESQDEIISLLQPVDISVYQIKVTLEEIKPPIWRRIQVTSDTALGKFHRILQAVMGWSDSHLHQFIIGRMYYGVPHSDYMFQMKNEKNVILSQIVSGEKAKFIYEYDFGDSWYHKILIEKVLSMEPDKYYPVCLEGKRACPPEDCGGISGYYGFMEAIQNPNHPEHKHMLKWIGGSFDPEAFDLDEINRELKKIR